MNLTNFNVLNREVTNKGAVKAIRREGLAPAVYYGKGKESKSLTFNTADFKKIWKAGSRNVLFNLVVEGEKEGLAAIVYDVQIHPITREVLHVDFKEVSEDQLLKVNIPVHLVGEASGVKNDGGMLVKLVRTVKLLAKPADIPASIEIDITDYPAPFTFYFENLDLPENVIEKSSPRTVIFAIQKGRGK